jgi:hypothetical protein
MAMKQTALLLSKQQRHHQQPAFSLSRSSLWCCCLSIALPTLASAFVNHPPVAARRSTRCFLSSSSTSSTSSSMSSSSSSSIPLPKLATGGDFAGFSATFVPTTGQLVPIPEYLVPEALLDWGQAPSSLEIIVSEDIIHDGDSSGSTDMTKSWSRQTVTAYPAVGCGVDNLDTQKQEQEWQTIWREDTVRVAVRAAAAPANAVAVDPAKQVWTVEVSFGWNPEQLQEASESSTADSSSGSGSSHRVSMQVTATMLEDTAAAAAAVQLQSPVHVRLERQTDAAASSRGMIADGGGLDGRQVSQLLGATLRKQSGFAAEPKNTKATVRWEAAVTAEDDSSSLVRLSERIHFPGNLTLAIGSSGDDDSASVLEVSHITSINDHQSVRHVVQCTLPPSTPKSKSNNDATTTGLPVVRSWTEEGSIQIV